MEKQFVAKLRINFKDTAYEENGVVADHFADVSKTITMPKKTLWNTKKLPGMKATETKNAE